MTLLAAKNISRHFGGLRAVDDVSLTVERGEIHAVIGTNGAGKSTLINVLCGEIEPTSGRVELMGRDVTRWTQPRRAQAGLGRSYQRTTIFPNFTRARKLPAVGAGEIAKTLGLADAGSALRLIGIRGTERPATHWACIAGRRRGGDVVARGKAPT